MADYLRHAEALEFIGQCERDGKPILGIELFLVDESSVRPVGVADWTGCSSEESWEESRRLLRDGIPDGGNAVEFVTDV